MQVVIGKMWHMLRVTSVTKHALVLGLLSIFGDYSWRAHMWNVSSSYFWIFLEGARVKTFLAILGDISWSFGIVKTLIRPSLLGFSLWRWSTC
jgi:hypothetical protein